MADAAEKFELGGSLMVTGLAVWVVDLLVAFFLPGALRADQHRIFVFILMIMAVVGLVLMITGYKLRGKAEPN